MCRLTIAAALLMVFGGAPADARVASVELASAARPQATAPQNWLQLLAKQGITSTRLRPIQGNEQPSIENLGTADRPLLKLVGVLTPRNELLLPGGRFKLTDAARLSEYFKRLGAEGPEGVTAKRGRFGLTEREFAMLFHRLTPPLRYADASPTLGNLTEGARLSIDPQVAAALRVEPEGLAQVKSLSQGTALAVLLRQEGLALQPTNAPGEPVGLRVVEAIAKGNHWPIGYEPERSPSETFPMLFERINVEVEGYTLDEAITAIGGQLEGLPIVWDRFVLRRDGIDPTQVPVKLAPTRTLYKRILDRLLFQARLKGELRTDEADHPFLWVTR